MSQQGPWISFNNMPALNASNTLYVVHFREEIGYNMRFGWALSMLTLEAQKQLRALGRRYADGLKKYEPSGLQQIRLPIPHEGTSYKKPYIRAVRALAMGNKRKAQQIAKATLRL